MSDFSEAVEDCGLSDMGFRGPIFTWSNKREGSAMISERLDRVACGSLLDSWNASKKRELMTNILIRRAALKEASNTVIPASWRVISSLEHHLNCALDTEERYWRQCARIEWLHEGDRNRRFFHSKASTRRSCNSIAGLINEKGEWVEKKNELEDVISQYFKNIFSNSNPSLANIAAITNGAHAKFDSSGMSVLNKPFGGVEIRSAVFDMSPMKAPGPTIISACLGILNDGVSAESINITIISLIPKCQTPRATTDFRPISLCNVIYKIVSKVVVSRLRRILGSVIVETQCAFIPGRMISDNSIIGFECLHRLKRRKRKFGSMAIKFDMAKAYDRVEWNFIGEMMRKLGFPVKWIQLIMNCISTVLYSFMLNGEVCGYIKPTRGPRQGDPISSYLFLICAEGFSSLIDNAANEANCAAIREILAVYAMASGQVVNLNKSVMCISPSMSAANGVELASIVGVNLGSLCFTCRRKRKLFSDITDKVWNKIKGWGERFLSLGGKEMLIKVVIQAIPMYAMNIFRLPKGLVCEIHRLCARFWWGSSNDNRKLHWCKWSRLCISKRDGGLGFRDLETFNKALLAKQCLRVYKNLTSLTAWVLKDCYFPSCIFLEAEKKFNASFVWKSLTGV
ncbi:hypothetical protein Dsin_019452 [Dipteronia sinensis]|uniref:Reverse transcriptase domain-containing protein n=1 Tax=Dipteronia sinensis TaxID=43782 RepID=A0AAE0E325_9ROSI|nr:hypothetical protein Dsin_019452 [Dipteronia sinensis]